MSSKTILIISDSLPGALTSTSAMVESLQREFENLGHEVHTAGMGSEDVLNGRRLTVFAPTLKSRRLPVRVLTEFIASLWLGVKLLLAMAIGRLPRPDIVIHLTPSLFLCLPAVLVKAVSSSALYLVQRDIVPDWLVASGRVQKSGLVVRLLYGLKNFSLNSSDHIGIECEQNLRFFPERFHHKISVLHNWRDFSRDVFFEPPATEDVVFVYGGRLGEVQGFDRFLRPFLRLQGCQARLKIFCDERGRSEIDALGLDPSALGRVEILPMLPESQFLEAASKAWFGVVSLAPTMQTHNIPGKTLGYLAAGIPVFVIGPREAALADVVQALDIGRYVDSGDEQAVQDALAELIAHPERRLNDRAAIVRARESFSPAAACQAILSALKFSLPPPSLAKSSGFDA